MFFKFHGFIDGFIAWMTGYINLLDPATMAPMDR